jgi:small subunit ribosomal protein S17e
MGRIRTKFIKRNTRKIMKEYEGKFTGEFEHNKKVLDENVDIYGTKLRNKIAGYITKLMKQKKKKKVKAAEPEAEKKKEPISS